MRAIWRNPTGGSRAVLFSASIRENVLYGRPGASDAEVWYALENANIATLSRRLPTSSTR